ncbi:hypothetical protein TTHERM_00732500 (macronuclear) [Tetrahymena thermophila SB210]|uniref:Uncharacterized protein n=1 Tax=Tetrahymena thermophila (strain SB210) TaxID=312017 RepID=Q245G1_TETTS|nr:hypothetical protein TTHERM_00732500 [Tetrahymena thermophila SB210]EAS03403.2 hypothetical protein TTHERM_00732500 [Tetrahymena thermophila SB210]|eukprot:XP_001023648.2 hypothetical protein TTHERM_00732500 [Tetrahymena thermophila SB210]
MKKSNQRTKINCVQGLDCSKFSCSSNCVKCLNQKYCTQCEYGYFIYQPTYDTSVQFCVKCPLANETNIVSNQYCAECILSPQLWQYNLKCEKVITQNGSRDIVSSNLNNYLFYLAEKVNNQVEFVVNAQKDMYSIQRSSPALNVLIKFRIAFHVNMCPIYQYAYRVFKNIICNQSMAQQKTNSAYNAVKHLQDAKYVILMDAFIAKMVIQSKLVNKIIKQLVNSSFNVQHQTVKQQIQIKRNAQSVISLLNKIVVYVKQTFQIILIHVQVTVINTSNITINQVIPANRAVKIVWYVMKQDVLNVRKIMNQIAKISAY